MNLMRKKTYNKKSRRCKKKKLNLKKAVSILLVCLIPFSSLTSCAKDGSEENVKEGTQENVKMEKVFDYVLDAGTYTELDYDFAEKVLTEKYDGWGGACSAIATVTNDGTPLVGRNMDLFISNKPAYISRTKVDGCYETVGLSYSHKSGPDYEDALKNGIPESTYKTIPFLATQRSLCGGQYA